MQDYTREFIFCKELFPGIYAPSLDVDVNVFDFAKRPIGRPAGGVVLAFDGWRTLKTMNEYFLAVRVFSSTFQSARQHFTI